MQFVPLGQKVPRLLTQSGDVNVLLAKRSFVLSIDKKHRRMDLINFLRTVAAGGSQKANKYWMRAKPAVPRTVPGECCAQAP